jgi:AcrR family transcriptional regulator
VLGGRLETDTARNSVRHADSHAEMPSDADSRAEILRQAAEFFMDRGYAGTSIDDVARALGATKGRIYHHYPSKADLFADVFRTGMSMNFAVIEQVEQIGRSAAEKWNAMALAHTLNMIRTRAFQRAVWEGVSMHLRGSTTPEQREVFGQLLDSRNRYSRIFRTVIEKAREQGSMRFDNAGIATELMFVTLNSPIFWYKPRRGESETDVERLASEVVGFAFKGLGGSPEA